LFRNLSLAGEKPPVLEVLHSDAILKIEEVFQLFETQLISSEVFTESFELDMAARTRSMPGDDCVPARAKGPRWAQASLRHPAGWGSASLERKPCYRFKSMATVSQIR
jgi:hypothetical protein